MKHLNKIRILKGPEIRSLLYGSEQELLTIIRNAYVTYGERKYSLPHSVFLKFPDKAKNRIISLPAYLGGEHEVSGVKWISSFPDNVQLGIDRASGVIVLNCCETGRPIAFLEASTINACRTAASAAIAAERLILDGSSVRSCGLVGCGYIGFESLSYLRTTFPTLEKILLYDLNPDRARHLASRLKEAFNIEVVIASKPERAMKCDMVIFATTASEPWVTDSAVFKSDSLILNISLRDLSPEVILSSQNVVDDLSHVSRENTSIHLAALKYGHQRYVDGDLPDILCEKVKFVRKEEKPLIFSPFGLGILDIAVRKWLLSGAVEKNIGTVVDDFFPDSWRPIDTKEEVF